MRFVRATFELYRQALVEGSRAYGRGIVGALGLLLGGAFLTFVSYALRPLAATGGIAGGFLLGFLLATLTAYVVGAYLATVEAALSARRMLGPEVLKDAVGHYFSETIGVMFWLWIVSMVVGLVVSGMVAAAFWLVMGVLLNPIPELIYTSRRQAPAIFEESARWIWTNWPEWLIPQLVVGATLAFFVPEIAVVLSPLVAMRFGFLEGIVSMTQAVAATALSEGLPLWRVGLEALLVPLVVHAVMVFRGALFRAMSGGGRRSRAWRSRNVDRG